MSVSRRVGPPLAAVEEMEVGDDLVLFHRDTERVLVLNASASDAWRLSDGSHDEDSFVVALARAYGSDPETIRLDVLDLLESLRGEGFLT